MHDRIPMSMETSVLIRLNAMNLRVAAAPVEFAPGIWHFDFDSSTITATEFLVGDDLETRYSQPALNLTLGVLNRLHHHARKPRSASADRIRELGQDVLKNRETSTLIRRVVTLLTNDAGLLASLPTVWIHGDLNFSNVLLTKGGVRLVDFEHARSDIRILDLAALTAPLRDTQDGALCHAPDLSDEILIRSANAQLDPPLSERERELFPSAVILHLLRIFRDVTRKDARAAKVVLPALEAAMIRYD